MTDEREPVANERDGEPSDYLTTDRVAALDRPSGTEAPDADPAADEGEINPEASNYGSP